MPPAQKILLIGAECTGKSTLANALAQKFNTHFVPEYLRTFLENKPKGYICQYDDLIPIAQGQIELENKLIKTANRFLFCDTSLLLLKVYSEYYFKQCPDFILNTIPTLTYDKILLTDNIGIEWVADGQRDLPNGHNFIYGQIIETLNFYNLDYHKISGNLNERLEQVYQLLNH